MLEESRGSGAPFVGRQQELRRIDDAWVAGERLITLLGPGGAGKTRLALEAARRHEDVEVVVCRLDDARTLEDLLAQVGEALALGPLGGSPAAAIERIGRALTRGAPLLVLDGFERHVEHAAATVRRWLARAPELRCLVTSRRALGLDEEQRVELGPLTDDEGVALFLAQARRARAGWSPDAAERATIREIGRRLDGLPLAIKLCAARAALLSPAELLARLASRFELLQAGHDDPVTRHRSLQAALDGSWELLGARERDALARYSVLRGSFDVPAAEAMLADVGGGLDALQELCEHSLVRVLEPEPGAPARFALLETVREHAAERLAEAGTRATAEALAVAHYRRVATRLGAGAGPLSSESAAELRREREHLLFVVEWLLPRDPEGAVALLLALHDELVAQERRDRHLELLGAGIVALRARAGGPLLAQALVARADVLRLHADLADAERHAAEAAAIARALAPGAAADAVIADALRLQGDARRGRGDTDGAMGCLGEALARARAAADRRREGLVRLSLVSACYAARRFEEVEREATAAYAIWSALGDRAQQAAALTARGVVLFDLDRLADARPVLEEALAAYRAVGHRQGEGRVGIVLAELACAQGRHVEAAALARDALALHRAQGAHPWTEMDLAVLALVEIERGRPDEALACARQAEASMGPGEYVRIRALVQACRGVAEAASGAVAAAEAAFAAARASATGLEPALVEFVAVCSGCVEVARAARHQAAGQAGAARLELARARARLDAVRAPHGTLAAASQHVRAARRILGAAIAGLAEASAGHAAGAVGVAVAATVVEAGAARRLRIGPGAHDFSPPGGGRIALDRRAWCRLLEALARHRVERPGDGLSTDELFAAAWPGERALKHAASNRVWVALSGLRGLGLEALIVRRRGRYLLDPGVEVELDARLTR